MLPRRLAALLVTMVLPVAPAAFSRPTSAVSTRSPGVWLRSASGTWVIDEPEQQLYLDAEKRIVETIRTADTPTIGLVMRALQEIENIPDVLQEDDRDGLRYTVGEVLGTIVEPGDPLILDLLRDPDPAIQYMAVPILFEDSSAWLQDPELRSLLQELVEVPAEDAAVVTGILRVYALADRFDEVRPTALALARGEEVELAEEVALVIAWSYQQEEDLAGLRQLFQESDGPLRQVAAIWLAESFAELSPDERTQVAGELVRTMEDPSLSPDFRGSAIEAANWLRNEPIVDNALLGLLEPEAWFFGVPDHPRPIHSLTAVLGSLDARPGIAGDLLKLKGHLDLLEDEYRSDVERSIDETLSKLSVIVD